jgi:seryl-tRNA synthetase
MLDPKFIRENKEKIEYAIHNKKIQEKIDVDKLLKLDSDYSEKLQEVEAKRAVRNELSDKIGKADKDEREKVIKEATKLKDELSKLEEHLKELEEKRDELLKKVPNVVAEDVPAGKDDSENQVIRTWGEIPNFKFKPREHFELGENLGIINTEKSAEIVGTRFNYLMGDAALMQFALVQFILNTLTDKKIISKLAKEAGSPHDTTFTPVVPPMMMREEVMDKMDRLHPKDERYLLEQDGLVLIGSAEHTLGPLHMGETINKENLPIRYIGYSTAFRREAGTYGKDTKGILRVHQFDKLEMESFTSAEDGESEQKLMVAIQEYILQQLKIPYQVVMICTGDMGKPDYRQVDIESWIPGQDKYRETHTSDYMTDYQSRRLGIKYTDGKNSEYVYMNDATAVAIGRMLIAILENYQKEDGSIEVPKVLQKYMGKKEIRGSRK